MFVTLRIFTTEDEINNNIIYIAPIAASEAHTELAKAFRNNQNAKCKPP